MASLNTRAKTLILMAAAALLTAAVVGGVVWAYQQRTIDRLEAEAKIGERELAQLTAQLDAVRTELDAATLGSSTAPTTSTGPEEPAVAGSTGAAAPAPSPPVKAKVERQFTFIKKVSTSGSKKTIVADYAQLLTGDAAAAAATAHGDESPPPNDYYIVNDNPKLRTLSVLADAEVKLTTKSDGTTAGPNGYPVSLAEFASLFNSTPAIRSSPYYVTLTDGKVSLISEMYVP